MADNLTDPIDIGTQTGETFRQEAENAVRLKNKPDQVKNEDGTWPYPDCEDCGVDIPKARLEATGSTLCVGCAEVMEFRQSRRG